jgi:septum formation protein
MQLILASSSPARANLLASIHVFPDEICPASIDETPHKNELPAHLALRLAKAKGLTVAGKFTDAYIIAADTVSACGRRILPKAETDQQVKDCLNLLSGRRHRVYTGVAIFKVINNEIIQQASKLVTSVVKLKLLQNNEIENYILSKEGLDKSGGLNIEGLAGAYVSFISGSNSNIIGLPLYETYTMLTGLGFKHQIK